MKFGMRTPSIKKSIKARTTGRIKRAAKKSVNPFYGKRGTGYVKNPSRAIYNKIYQKTSFGVSDLLKPKKQDNRGYANTSDESLFRDIYTINESPVYINLTILCFILGIIAYLIGQFVLLLSNAFIIKFMMVLPFIIGICSLIKAIIEYNNNKQIVKEMSLKLNREITVDSVGSIREEMEEYLYTAESSMDTLLHVCNVDAFFAEYRFVIQVLNDATEIECIFEFPNGSPSEILDNFQKNFGEITNEFIERMYDITLDKIQNLKTEKAKKNNANKFKETFDNYIEFMPQESQKKVTDLYGVLLDECNVEP